MSALTELLDAQADTVEVSTASTASSPEAPAQEMSGLRKAAIVLMNMDRAAGAEVLRHLGEERSEMLAAELTQLGGVDVASTARALGEFRRIATGGSVPSRGGQELATGLLETAFGREKAVGMVGRVMSQGSVSFDFLNAADPAQLAHQALDADQAQTLLGEAAKTASVKKGVVMKSLRAALLGSLQGPDLVATLLLLQPGGEAVARLQRSL